MLTLKHVDAGLWAISHGVHENERQELGENNPHFRTNQLVGDHLGKQGCCLLPHRWVLRVTEQIEEVNQGPYIYACIL